MIKNLNKSYSKKIDVKDLNSLENDSQLSTQYTIESIENNMQAFFELQNNFLKKNSLNQKQSLTPQKNSQTPQKENKSPFSNNTSAKKYQKQSMMESTLNQKISQKNEEIIKMQMIIKEKIEIERKLEQKVQALHQENLKLKKSHAFQNQVSLHNQQEIQNQQRIIQELLDKQQEMIPSNKFQQKRIVQNEDFDTINLEQALNIIKMMAGKLETIEKQSKHLLSKVDFPTQINLPNTSQINVKNELVIDLQDELAFVKEKYQNQILGLQRDFDYIKQKLNSQSLEPEIINQCDEKIQNNLQDPQPGYLRILNIKSKAIR